MERRVRGADNLLYRVLDLTDKSDLSGSGGGQPPEFVQEPIIGLFDSRLSEGFGHVVAFGFLDIEAHPLDPFLDIEIEHLVRCRHAGRRQHRDYVVRNLMAVQKPNAGDRPVKGASPRAGQPVAVVKMPWAVDAEPDTDQFLREKPTPCLVDQGPVGLKRMSHYDVRGLEEIDHPERIAIEVDRQNHRLA